MAARHTKATPGGATATSPRPEHPQRKAEHVLVAAAQEVEAPQVALWEDIHLVHNCLPELDMQEIDLGVTFLGHSLRFPVIIAALTGGFPGAAAINEALATAAQELGIGLELGSGRPLLDYPELAYTYTVARKAAPDAFLVANIGAPQLLSQGRHRALTAPQVQRLAEALEADALAVHLNFLQEAVMPQGDTQARGGLRAIEALCHDLPLPVIAKETGAGISGARARDLREAGVQALDLGGAGGTSMALVEAARAALRGDARRQRLGRTFGTWGIPTPISIIQARAAGLPLIASGGIRSGLDGAKALALGADLVGIGRPLLAPAQKGAAAVIAWLEEFIEELRIAHFLAGAATPLALRQKNVRLLGKAREWLQALEKENP